MRCYVLMHLVLNPAKFNSVWMRIRLGDYQVSESEIQGAQTPIDKLSLSLFAITTQFFLIRALRVIN